MTKRTKKKPTKKPATKRVTMDFTIGDVDAEVRRRVGRRWSVVNALKVKLSRWLPSERVVLLLPSTNSQKNPFLRAAMSASEVVGLRITYGKKPYTIVIEGNYFVNLLEAIVMDDRVVDVFEFRLT